MKILRGGVWRGVMSDFAETPTSGQGGEFYPYSCQQD